MSEIDLRKLAEPFPAGDIKWRVARSGLKDDGTAFCIVFAYITARAIQTRLDDVCGPANWCNTPLQVHEMRVNVNAIQVGISIRIDGEWITKYDVAEPTNIEPAKGGFSGAMKRAGSAWGIGRYLSHLKDSFAETSKKQATGFVYARLPKDDGGGVYYWKPPQLPAWALPLESKHDNPITDDMRNDLYFAWKKKFAAAEKRRDVLRAAFDSWVFSIVGEFPIGDLSCWTQQIVDDCRKRIEATVAGGKGPSADVDFG